MDEGDVGSDSSGDEMRPERRSELQLLGKPRDVFRRHWPSVFCIVERLLRSSSVRLDSDERIIRVLAHVGGVELCDVVARMCVKSTHQKNFFPCHPRSLPSYALFSLKADDLPLVINAFPDSRTACEVLADILYAPDVEHECKRLRKAAPRVTAETLEKAAGSIS